MLNILTCATYNENNMPEIHDIDKALNILINHSNEIVLNLEKYIDYCVENNLYDE